MQQLQSFPVSLLVRLAERPILQLQGMMDSEAEEQIANKRLQQVATFSFTFEEFKLWIVHGFGEKTAPYFLLMYDEWEVVSEYRFQFNDCSHKVVAWHCQPFVGEFKVFILLFLYEVHVVSLDVHSSGYCPATLARDKPLLAFLCYVATDVC